MQSRLAPSSAARSFLPKGNSILPHRKSILEQDTRWRELGTRGIATDVSREGKNPGEGECCSQKWLKQPWNKWQLPTEGLSFLQLAENYPALALKGWNSQNVDSWQLLNEASGLERM